MKYELSVFIYIIIAASVEAFLFNSHLSRDLARCPGNVHKTTRLWTFRDHCIEFVVDGDTYWDNARDVCRHRGGHLMKIPDDLTQSFLMFALKTFGYSGSALWIGLSDIDQEQHWMWVTGESLHGYSHWGDGQNAGGLFHIATDCVALQYDDKGRWHDKFCHLLTDQLDFICQYNMIPMTTKITTPKTTTTTTRSTTTTSTTPIPTTTKTQTPTPTLTTKTTITTTTTVACQEIDCQKSCANGYSGIFVGIDGCIACRCN